MSLAVGVSPLPPVPPQTVNKTRYEKWVICLRVFRCAPKILYQFFK